MYTARPGRKIHPLATSVVTVSVLRDALQGCLSLYNSQGSTSYTDKTCNVHQAFSETVNGRIITLSRRPERSSERDDARIVPSALMSRRWRLRNCAFKMSRWKEYRRYAAMTVMLLKTVHLRRCPNVASLSSVQIEKTWNVPHRSRYGTCSLSPESPREWLSDVAGERRALWRDCVNAVCVGRTGMQRWTGHNCS